MMSAVFQSKLLPSEKTLLIRLIYLSTDWVTVTHNEIGRALSLSGRRIKQITAGLKKAGWLESRRDGTSNRYRVLIPSQDSQS